MKKFVLFFYCVGAVIPVMAQEVFQSVNNVADYVLLKDDLRRQRMENSDIEGSPYLHPDFVAGDIYTTKDTFKGILVRYDVYNHWLEFKEKGIVYILDPSINIHKVVLGDQVLYIQPYDDKGKIKVGFFKVIEAKNVKLLVKRVIQFQDRRPAKALESSSTPPKYLPAKDQFYLKVNKTSAAVHLFNVKKIIELIPDHQKSIESFIKRKKTSLEEKELTELMAYYEKLD